METLMTNAADRLEPRWPAMLALLAVGGLRLALPESLSVGPDWLLITIVGVLLIPTAWARQRGLDTVNKIFGYVLTSIVTIDMVWSLCLLVAACLCIKNHPKISCVQPRLCGSQTSLSSHHGTGGLMRAVLAPVNCGASTQMELFYFRK
jgi:hypothetical protein